MSRHHLSVIDTRLLVDGSYFQHHYQIWSLNPFNYFVYKLWIGWIPTKFGGPIIWIYSNYGTHILEIKAFHDFFETEYLFHNLCRTIHEAAKTLKRKLVKKIPKIGALDNNPNKYDVALGIGIVKFPPLRTCKFGIAYCIKLPKWFILRP
jgi:hypothetical protein